MIGNVRLQSRCLGSGLRMSRTSSKGKAWRAQWELLWEQKHFYSLSPSLACWLGAVRKGSSDFATTFRAMPLRAQAYLLLTELLTGCC
jgi:hypothetical protein